MAGFSKKKKKKFVDIFFNKVLFRFHVWKKKKFEGDPLLLLGIHFYCYVCVAQQIINSLYFFFIIYLGDFFLKNLVVHIQI